MDWIEKPNLPNSAVALCAISSKENKLIEKLKSLGIDVLEVDAIGEIDSPVASHADMQIHHLKNNRLIMSPHNRKLILNAEYYGFSVTTAQALDKKYPKDIIYNIARVGDICFCNEKFCSETILDELKKMNVSIVSVAQGYAKCSTCVVSENAIISEDPSIVQAAKSCGLDVLHISYGDVVLEGYTYGFLGGCCGLIDKKTIAFTGDISTHRDYKEICRFLKKHDLKTICLSTRKLLDVGGIIPLILSTH